MGFRDMSGHREADGQAHPMVVTPVSHTLLPTLSKKVIFCFKTIIFLSIHNIKHKHGICWINRASKQPKSPQKDHEAVQRPKQLHRGPQGSAREAVQLQEVNGTAGACAKEAGEIRARGNW